MISTEAIAELESISRDDVLSVALDVDPSRPEHQVAAPAYRIVFRNAARVLRRGVARSRRADLSEILARVGARLDDPPRGRGVAIFAAPGLWREFVLPLPLPNRIRYGRPDLISLLWAVDDYKSCAIVAVDRQHVRILRTYLGGIVLLDAETFVVDIRDWAFKSGALAPASKKAGVSVSRGRQADAFDHRVEAQVDRFWRGAAEAAGRALVAQPMSRIILAGTEDAVHAFGRLLPGHLREAIIGTVHVSPPVTLTEIQQRALPVALAAEHRRESALIAGLLERTVGRQEAVVGRDATLAALRRGQARLVVADRDLPGEAWWCSGCYDISAEGTQRCPRCGRPVERLSLGQALPVLVRRHGGRLELVGPDSGAALRPYDGIGAILRYAIGPPATAE